MSSLPPVRLIQAYKEPTAPPDGLLYVIVGLSSSVKSSADNKVAGLGTSSVAVPLQLYAPYSVPLKVAFRRNLQLKATDLVLSALWLMLYFVFDVSVFLISVFVGIND